MIEEPESRIGENKWKKKAGVETGLCMTPYVQNAARTARYRSNPQKAGQCTAENATDRKEDSRITEVQILNSLNLSFFVFLILR